MIALFSFSDGHVSNLDNSLFHVEFTFNIPNFLANMK